jgi:hypothetical protein
LKAQRSSSASIPSSSTTFSPSFPSAHNAALGKFFSTPDTGTLQYQLEILYLRFPSSGCFSLKPSHDCMHLVQISVQVLKGLKESFPELALHYKSSLSCCLCYFFSLHFSVI